MESRKPPRIYHYAPRGCLDKERERESYYVASLKIQFVQSGKYIRSSAGCSPARKIFHFARISRVRDCTSPLIFRPPSRCLSNYRCNHKTQRTHRAITGWKLTPRQLILLIFYRVSRYIYKICLRKILKFFSEEKKRK